MSHANQFLYLPGLQARFLLFLSLQIKNYKLPTLFVNEMFLKMFLLLFPSLLLFLFQLINLLAPIKLHACLSCFELTDVYSNINNY